MINERYFPENTYVGLQEEFQGKTLHSTDYTNADAYVGKKVVVVGACSSGA